MPETLRLKAWTRESSLTLRELSRAILSGKITASLEDVEIYNASAVFPEAADTHKTRLSPVASLAFFAMSKLRLSYAETMDGIPVAVLFQMIAAFNEENGIDYRFAGEQSEKERRMKEATTLLQHSSV